MHTFIVESSDRIVSSVVSFELASWVILQWKKYKTLWISDFTGELYKSLNICCQIYISVIYWLQYTLFRGLLYNLVA